MMRLIWKMEHIDFVAWATPQQLTGLIGLVEGKEGGKRGVIASLPNAGGLTSH